MWKVFPIVQEYIKGATASSLNEARLCFEELQTPAHVFAPVYDPADFDELCSYSSHLVFNSMNQFSTFYPIIKASGRKISCGIRVNPEQSDVSTDLYNPSSPKSRLGVVDTLFPNELPEGIEGLHFHTLCESTSYSLAEVLTALETRFGKYLSHIKWVNMGGGHLMTREGYDVEHLIETVSAFSQKHNVQVILEPGSAFAWDTGVLTATVLDIVESKGVKTAMLNVSFAAHMPDTLEMPYRPRVRGASAEPMDSDFKYRLGGSSCLAGDFMEEYGFDHELQIGETLIFEDMIHYTMVKTTLFNGVKHPSIGMLKANGEFELFRSFTYDDFKNRLS